MAKYKEVKQKITEGCGKATFSQTDFNEIAVAILNDPSMVKKFIKKTKDGHEEAEVTPVSVFRTWLMNEVLKHGVDKEEAKKILTEEYTVNKLDIYPLISVILTEYLETGHKFNFLPEYDLKASINLKEVKETTKTFNNPKTGEKFDKTIPAHRVLSKSSSCPIWKK